MADTTAKPLLSTAGDAELAAAFVRHAGWLRTVVIGRLGDPHAAEDVLQEVAVAAWKQRANWTDWRCQSAWFYRVAIRQTLLYRRKQSREGRKQRRLAQQLPAVGSSIDEQPIGTLLSLESHELVRQSLDRVPEKDRQILLLKYSEDWSCKDIAEHLGIRVSTVETRLFRARRRLRRELIQQGQPEDSS